MAINVKWDIIQIKCANCGSDMLVTNGPWGVFTAVQIIPNALTDLMCRYTKKY